jgi:Protein of unknown function (DUF3102)
MMPAVALHDARADSLAEAIEAEHRAACCAAQTALQHAMRCGELLTEAKAAVGHGGWLAWVEANLSFGDRQARKYMRLARHSEQIGICNPISASTKPWRRSPIIETTRSACSAAQRAPNGTRRHT